MLDLAFRLGGGRWIGGTRPSTPSIELSRHKRFHVSQSMLLVGGMLAVLGLCGLSLGQAAGLSRLLQRRASDPAEGASSATLLRQLGAWRIGPGDLPPLLPLLDSISRRAGLARAPELYCLPGPTMNAFALGGPHRAIIAVTAGLLHNLTLDELAGILAHEVAHLRNSDSATLALAHDLTTATELMSLIGLMLLQLEAAERGARVGPGAAQTALLLALAPMISRLLQLALSRTRELDADLDAIELSGGAAGLIRALAKLQRHHAADEAATRAPLGALFRSHPETPFRLRRLFENAIAAGRLA